MDFWAACMKLKPAHQGKNGEVQHNSAETIIGLSDSLTQQYVCIWPILAAESACSDKNIVLRIYTLKNLDWKFSVCCLIDSSVTLFCAPMFHCSSIVRCNAIIRIAFTFCRVQSPPLIPGSFILFILIISLKCFLKNWLLTNKWPRNSTFQTRLKNILLIQRDSIWHRK